MAKTKEERAKEKAKKDLDKEIGDLYRIHGNCVEINMMDIPKLYAECKRVREAGGDMESAMIVFISTHRTN